MVKDLHFPVVLRPFGAYDDTLSLKVLYKRPKHTCSGRKLDVYIKCNDPNYEDGVVHLQFIVEQARPQIGAIPGVVDFGQVDEGDIQKVQLIIKNFGHGPLKITKMKYHAEKEGFSFKMNIPGKGETSDILPAGQIKTIEFDPPLELWDYETITLNMVYKAMDSGPAKGQLVFFSNDPKYPSPDGFVVNVQANVGGPCIRAIPSSVDFGAVLKEHMDVHVVKLVGCGDEIVKVTSIALTKDSNKNFSLDLQALPNIPSKSNPLVVHPGDEYKIVVKYLPTQANKVKDKDGNLIPDQGMIEIKNSSPKNPLEIGLKGIGVDASAPVADFEMEAHICNPPGCNAVGANCTTKVVKSGDTVPPQTLIKFHNLSTDPTMGGKIVRSHWEVVQPPDANATFYPTADFPEPSICLNQSGDYTFLLTVINNAGIPSEKKQKSLKVTSGEGLHIELVWHTPTDPDETDECGPSTANGHKGGCGTDMDLHFLHPLAYGDGVNIPGVGRLGYFSDKWDCYFLNPHPKWADNDNFKPDEDPNPNLDRDDTDGAGPENLNLRAPQEFDNGACYRVGVHYFDDHGYGASFATVKIYIDGKLVWQKKNVRMSMLDLWDAAQICWKKNDPDKKKFVKPIVPPNGKGVVIYHNIKYVIH